MIEGEAVIRRMGAPSSCCNQRSLERNKRILAKGQGVREREENEDGIKKFEFLRREGGCQVIASAV